MGTTNTLPGSSRQGDSWRTKWADFYAARSAVLTTLTEHAEATAKSAVSAAQTAQNDVNAMKYLKDAMGQKTDTIGGLILTSMIVMRNTDKSIMAGMNGIYSSPTTIAFWAGGANVENQAKILFRMNGSGYVAAGNISWDAGGNLTIQGYALKSEIIRNLSGMNNDVGFITGISWPGVTSVIANSNEFNICDSTPSGNKIWLNYRGRQGGNLSSAISSYYFGNGQGGYTGTVLYCGDVSGASDIRLKDVIAPVALTVEQVADIPVFSFTWKDKKQKGRFVGTSAQHIEKILPDAVRQDEEDILSLSYGPTALAAATATAKEVVELKKQVKGLQEEVRELRAMIWELMMNKDI